MRAREPGIVALRAGDPGIVALRAGDPGIVALQAGDPEIASRLSLGLFSGAGHHSVTWCR